MLRNTIVRRALLVVTLGAVAFGLQLRMAGVANAGPSGGNCGYGGSWTLSTYRSAGCAYGSIPYSQGSGDFVRINVYKAKTFASRIQTDIQSAVDRWNYSSANVRLQVVSSPSSSNPLTITSSYSGFNNDNCATGWAYGWDGGSGDYHQVVLNQYYLDSNCGSDNGWAGLIAHEMGHDMGLAHNVHRYNGDANCNGATYSMLMLGGCAIKSLSPQVTDYNIFNAIYPNYLKACATSPSNFNCNGMLDQAQGCGTPRDLQTVSDANVSVTLEWGNSCDSNFTKAKILTSGYTIYKEDLERNSGTDGPAWTMADMPDATQTVWVTSMLYSPNNSARGCVWYQSLSSGTVYGPVCTNYF